jgi:sialate O-acetylesterase
MNNCQRTALGAGFLWVATSVALHADVKLPAIFGDHMVLQEGAKLPVWGTADPNEAVTVTVGGDTGHATADGSGKWRVELKPLKVSATPVTVTVKGKNTVTFSDVLVGEVWVCSGQSNMEFGIGNDVKGKDTIAQATDPAIRLFLVPHATSLEPKSDIGPVAPGPGQEQTGKWQVCSPATLGAKWGWNGFSAVGYYFGREIHQATGKPVGLIGTYWGGTPAQAWTSLSGLEKDPELKTYVDHHKIAEDSLAKNTAAYPAALADYQTKLAAWKAGDGQAFMTQMAAWNIAAKTAAAANQPPPPKPVPATPMPRAPGSPDGGPGTPANLYNGMVAPLIPYAIKGAIWYQGEANGGRGFEYRTLFARMIKDWREKWGEGDFPFCWVQLASFDAGKIPSWAYLREAQAMTLSLPDTGMATAVDIGVAKNIHPPDKSDVGHRLALAAEVVAYGEKLVDSGPVYASMQAQGNAIRLSFTHKGGGLIIGQAPWVPQGATPLPTDHLTGFVIAGADQNFIPADAKIDGDGIVVSSAQVASPVAVRYDWSNVCDGNLYNKDGLPAPPFRTDDWMDPAAMGLPPKPAAPAPAAK